MIDCVLSQDSFPVCVTEAKNVVKNISTKQIK